LALKSKSVNENEMKILAYVGYIQEGIYVCIDNMREYNKTHHS